jgi:hypothetical protein
MSLPPEVADELRRLGASGALRRDLAALRAVRADPPLDPTRAAERSVDFVMQYNAFVNHAPKPFRPIRDADMRL